MTTLQDCQALDTADTLRPLRDLFDIPEGVIYLDGNSLGVMPKAAAARAAEVVTQEWGQGLIRSWNTAGWFNLPQRLGNQHCPPDWCRRRRSGGHRHHLHQPVTRC